MKTTYEGMNFFFLLFRRSVSKREGLLFQITIVTKRVDGGESSFPFSQTLCIIYLCKECFFLPSQMKTEKTQRA